MEISKILLKWYESAGRELPWRKSRNPYEIWVSEIILQQTQVVQGMGYYERFLKRFPDVFTLAKADLEDVLKIWQGLGYYSRARNMHYTANEIVKNHGGVFPEKYSGLLRLKGIGPYTAAAIASIVYGEKIPAIDGNVKRVISRISGIKDDISSTKAISEIRTFLLEVLPVNQAGEFNQALMDLGSMICLPRKPECPECPLHENCFAFIHNKQSELPVRTRKQKVRQRFFYFFIIKKDDHLYLEQRNQKDIWHKLYQFPLIESDSDLDSEDILERMHAVFFPDLTKIKVTKISGRLMHQLSHQLITARFIHVAMEERNELPPGRQAFKVPTAYLDRYAVPRLIEKYVDEAENL